MPATATSRRHTPPTYPRPVAPRVPSDRAATLLEALVRDALRAIREAGHTRCLAASQNFTDAGKGRPFGMRSLGRMLADAKRAGVPLHDALGIAGAVEAFTLAIWHEEVGVAMSLHLETAAQGEADCAQMRAALSGDDASLRLALEESVAHLNAQRRLVAALTREIARRGVA